jgi:hypothetical protein
MVLTHINFAKGLPMKPKTMSGAEFKERFGALITSLKDNDEVYFGTGDLSLHRFKDRGAVEGPRMVQIEFNEVYSVTVDPDDL